MNISRIEMLYQRKLVTAENTSKQIPFDHILQKELIFFPDIPQEQYFDMLEIGPGRGDFILALAQKFPQKKFITIEIGKKRFEKIKERIMRLQIPNITLVGGDARTLLYHSLFEKFTFEKVFVLFPDPWPRNKQRHRRLLQQDFINQLIKHISVPGEFTLATDVEDYARWVNGHLEKIEQLQNIATDSIFSPTLPDIIPTFFEKKWKSLGRNCFYLRYQKTASK